MVRLIISTLLLKTILPIVNKPIKDHRSTFNQDAIMYILIILKILPAIHGFILFRLLSVSALHLHESILFFFLLS